MVKLCNNLIFAAQMVATAEATTLARKSGVDMAKLHEVLTHSTGDCVAVRTRLPVEGVIPDSPASNGWKPGFMTDLMAKDIGLGARACGSHRCADAVDRARRAKCSPPVVGRGLRPGGLLRPGEDSPSPGAGSD